MRSGRFNWGVTTQNLAKVALKTLSEGGGEDKFFENFEYSAKIMEDAIAYRFEVMKNMRAKHAPILFQHGAICRRNPDDTLEDLFRSKQSSVSYGYFGLDDVIRILKNNETIIEHKEFAHKIMKKVKDTADMIGEKYGIPVSVYGTPFESLIHKAFEADFKDYGDVMPQWLLDRGYYTNSYHYSSELPIDAFSKLAIESEFVKYSRGGNINYSEIGSVNNNPTSILDLIQYVGFELIDFEKEEGIRYQAFNVRNDNCYECGHEGEIEYLESTGNYRCPVCGNENNMTMSIIKRCCGYLSNYNERKAPSRRMKEIANRAVHV